MQMYHLFRNLFKVWSTDFGTAVLYGNDQKSISYAELADMIRNAESEIRLSGIRSELIVTDHEPATLIRIFACVISGCDVILIDENMPDETLFALASMAGAESIYASDPDLQEELCEACGCAPRTIDPTCSMKMTDFVVGRQAGDDNCQSSAAARQEDDGNCQSSAAALQEGDGNFQSSAAVLQAGDENCHCSAAARQAGDDSCRLSYGIDDNREGRLIFFTSGTTGSSKAVVLTSESLLCSSFSGQSMLPCGPGDIILSLLPFSHVFGFVCTMLWGLTYGATIALGRGTRYLLSDCEFFKPTILPVVPSLLKMLMQQHALPASLKVVLVGAAPLDAVSVKALQNVGMKVYLGYGLTETSSGIAITQDQKDPFALYPCPGADIRIEPDGEISVATPCMMQGYLDFSETVREDAGSDEAENNDNSAYVLGHPIIPVEGGRLYTGDLGSLDTRGALCLTGRKKDMLVLPDGTKIFCPEYEEELSGLIGLSDLTVILKQDRPFLVIGDSGGNVPENIDSLLAEFNEKRAMGLRICGVLSYGKPLPRTATGKIRRWEIEK